MQGTNTIHFQLYTSSGVRLNFVIGIQDGKLTETLPPLADVETLIAQSGYLTNAPGVEPGEDVEEILHVCMVTKRDNKTGELIPHIAFYPSAPQLKMRFCHEYLNTQQDRDDFEAATGLRLASMPIAQSLPQFKDDESSIQFVVKLAKPIRIARDTRTQKDGKISHRVKRYVDTIGTPAATTGNGQQGSTPPKTVAPDFTPPPASGNGQQGSGTVDKSEWRKQVMDLTAFLYSDEINETYDEFNHTAAVQARMNDTSNMGISADKHTPEGAATVFLAYCVTTNLRLSVTEFPQALGGKSLKIFMDGYTDTEKGLQAAWSALSAHAHSKQQAASGQ